MAGELSGCISNILVSVILVYGAEKRNRAALLVWIILQTIGLTVVVLFSISIGFLVAFGFIGDSIENLESTLSDENYALPDDRHGIMKAAFAFMIVVFIGAIAFQIWIIYVAIEARKQILAEGLLPTTQNTNNDEIELQTQLPSYSVTNPGPNPAVFTKESNYGGHHMVPDDPPPPYTSFSADTGGASAPSKQQLL